MGKKFDFKDITLLPNFSNVDSRSTCDTSVLFGEHIFNLPVVPANMESVIDEKLAHKLASEGYFYILHRFNNNIIDFMRDMKIDKLVTSISIGVNEDSYTLINTLIDLHLIPDFITIDIAHGHSIKMKNMV